MAKPVRFRGDTSFNFGANVKPRKPKTGSKPKKGSKGGKGGGS